jgi:hypothetical protein
MGDFLSTRCLWQFAALVHVQEFIIFALYSPVIHGKLPRKEAMCRLFHRQRVIGSLISFRVNGSDASAVYFFVKQVR